MGVGIVNEHVYNEKDSTIRGKNQLKRDRSQEINLYEVPARTEGIKIETPLIIEKSYRTLEHAYGLTKDKSNLPNSKGHIGPTDYQVMKTNEFVKDKNALKNLASRGGIEKRKEIQRMRSKRKLKYRRW